MTADPSLVRFRKVVAGALTHLESRRQEINDLNVFPVADGDTGDNMALTLRAVLEEIDRLLSRPQAMIDEIGRDELVESLARAALLGARGNSGVILSQLIRGAAEELVSRPGELVDPILVGAAMAKASIRADASVRVPAEGTMLTVMRDMAQAIALALPHIRGLRTGTLTVAEQDAEIAGVLEAALRAGEDSVRRGPELLPVLKEAGVVDAGGHAVVILFAGVIAALRGTEGPEVAHQDAATARRVEDDVHSSSTFRYCTNFAVTGHGLDDTDWSTRLEIVGDSVLVVGDAATLRVHVHTDDPEAATAMFAERGEVSRLDVADMHEQVRDRDRRLAVADVSCGVLAVVAGAGMVGLFEDIEGVHCLDGGDTLNPSTAELLASIEAVPATEVIVLPNSPNVVMAAEKAAGLADKPVHVIPTRSMQAGLTAAAMLLADESIDDNIAGMTRALDGLRSGGVARAAREDAQGRFAVGEAVGFVDEQVVAWGAPDATLRAVFDALADGAELVTCIAGAGAPLDRAAVETLLADAEPELELHEGGQPAWWWLVSAE